MEENMKEKKVDLIYIKERVLHGQMLTKIYHIPQLMEWGDLQDLTRGTNFAGHDLANMGSQTSESPIDRSYPIPPWETPNP
jgi:hypothetical protein